MSVIYPHYLFRINSLAVLNFWRSVYILNRSCGIVGSGIAFHWNCDNYMYNNYFHIPAYNNSTSFIHNIFCVTARSTIIIIVGTIIFFRKTLRKLRKIDAEMTFSFSF